MLRPESRGRIMLAAPDPCAPPLIQPNYFDCDADLTNILAGLKAARRLVQATAFDAYRGDEVWPGHAAQSDKALGEFIRGKFQTLYHPVGTCKMGNDPLAVVDSQLRVHGVDGLRVVDASVMPTLIGGHPHAATVMIAEKGGRADCVGATCICARARGTTRMSRVVIATAVSPYHLARLDVRSRTQAAIWARKHGLLAERSEV